MANPHLTFFCELDGAQSLELFSDQVIADLSVMKANLSMGVMDLNNARAACVRRLNRAGVPVIARLLLPSEQGYWLNAGNFPQAFEQYKLFKDWTIEHGLRWQGIGLDFEPDIRDLEQWSKNRMSVLPGIVRRFFNRKRFRNTQRAYTQLVEEIHADGYWVESYIHPFIQDERMAGSTLYRKMTGLVDVITDREVLLLFSSSFQPNGVGMLGSYAPEAQAVGLGVIGVGSRAGLGEGCTLSWQEVERDLRLAWYSCDDIYLYTIEGCIQTGILTRLKEFQWDYPILLPEQEIEKVIAWRAALRSSLWFTAHLTPLFITALGIVLFMFSLRRLLHRRLRN
jgi:hypothetical protein